MSGQMRDRVAAGTIRAAERMDADVIVMGTRRPVLRRREHET
jgi:hypothetical protein